MQTRSTHTFTSQSTNKATNTKPKPKSTKSKPGVSSEFQHQNGQPLTILNQIHIDPFLLLQQRNSSSVFLTQGSDVIVDKGQDLDIPCYCESIKNYILNGSQLLKSGDHQKASEFFFKAILDIEELRDSYKSVSCNSLLRLEFICNFNYALTLIQNDTSTSSLKYAINVRDIEVNHASYALLIKCYGLNKRIEEALSMMKEYEFLINNDPELTSEVYERLLESLKYQAGSNEKGLIYDKRPQFPKATKKNNPIGTHRYPKKKPVQRAFSDVKGNSHHIQEESIEQEIPRTDAKSTSKKPNQKGLPRKRLIFDHEINDSNTNLRSFKKLKSVKLNNTQSSYDDNTQINFSQFIFEEKCTEGSIFDHDQFTNNQNKSQQYEGKNGHFRNEEPQQFFQSNFEFIPPQQEQFFEEPPKQNYFFSEQNEYNHRTSHNKSFDNGQTGFPQREDFGYTTPKNYPDTNFSNINQSFSNFESDNFFPQTSNQKFSSKPKEKNTPSYYDEINLKRSQSTKDSASSQPNIKESRGAYKQQDNSFARNYSQTEQKPKSEDFRFPQFQKEKYARQKSSGQSYGYSDHNRSQANYARFKESFGTTQEAYKRTQFTRKQEDDLLKNAYANSQRFGSAYEGNGVYNNAGNMFGVANNSFSFFIMMMIAVFVLLGIFFVVEKIGMLFHY